MVVFWRHVLIGWSVSNTVVWNRPAVSTSTTHCSDAVVIVTVTGGSCHSMPQCWSVYSPSSSGSPAAPPQSLHLTHTQKKSQLASLKLLRWMSSVTSVFQPHSLSWRWRCRRWLTDEPNKTWACDHVLRVWAAITVLLLCKHAQKVGCNVSKYWLAATCSLRHGCYFVRRVEVVLQCQR